MFKDFEHNGEQFTLKAETYNTHFEYWETEWVVTYPDNTKFDFSLKIASNNAEHPKCYDWIAEYAMWKRRATYPFDYEMDARILPRPQTNKELKIEIAKRIFDIQANPKVFFTKCKTVRVPVFVRPFVYEYITLELERYTNGQIDIIAAYDTNLNLLCIKE